MNAPQANTPAGNPKRKKALTAVALVVALAGIGYGAYYGLVLSHYEHTDNAYVQGNVVQLTPQVGGTVLAINADDTDFVKAGQVLVKLDPADAQVALDQAEAQLAQTVREVRTLYANNATYKAQIALREAELARAQADVARAQDDVNRRKPLLATGAVGKEEFEHASAQLAAARAAVASAQSAALDEALAAGAALDHDGWRRASLVTGALLIARAALRREESRGGHFRNDFPARDDLKWKVHISETVDLYR